MKLIIGERQGGKTTALLEAALAAKRTGTKIVIVVASEQRKAQIHKMAKELWPPEQLPNGAKRPVLTPKEVRTYSEIRESHGVQTGSPRNSGGPLLLVDDLDTMMYTMFYGRKPDLATLTNDGLAFLPLPSTDAEDEG